MPADAAAGPQDLLRRHLAGEDVTAEVHRLVGADPAMAPVLEMLARRGEQPAGVDELPDDVPSAAELRQQREIVERVRGQVDSLAADLDRLRATLEDLAGALGACPVCVGAAHDCALCHGRGGPGWIPPHPAAFYTYVVPAVRAHQYARRRAARPVTPDVRPSERNDHE